mmetsp:Transcript_56858/g.144188  ORF Transcript_56858/g.144188 Transcript_56858/m.144188 type:complete len:504 (+) Transcript_56858:2-1513(+)
MNPGDAAEGSPFGSGVNGWTKTASPLTPESIFTRVLRPIKKFAGLEVKNKLFSELKYTIRRLPYETAHMADKWYFNLIVVLCILTDSVLVGVESDLVRGDAFEDRMPFWICDLVLTIVYTTEMMVRIHQQSWEYFADAWNIFDYVCVLLSCTAIVQPMQEGSASKGDVVNLRVMKALKGFRLLRLLRVVRMIIGLKIVEGLWLLVSGLLTSMRTLFWIGIFCFILVYGLGCAIVVAADAALLRENWPEYDIYFGTVSRGMLTIWQVVTLDRWITIARPLVEYNPLAGVVLFSAIFVVTFGVLNVMLSVMVESVRAIMERSKQRTTLKLMETEKTLMIQLEREFRSRDYEEAGHLDYSEFNKLLATQSFAFKLRLFGVKFSEAEQLFQLMDVDHDGHVSWEEFRKGLHKMKGSAQGRDLSSIINFAQKNCRKARKYVERIERLSEHADIMQARLNAVGRGIVKQMDATKETERHTEDIMTQAKQRHRTIRRLKFDLQTKFPDSQ